MRYKTSNMEAGTSDRKVGALTTGMELGAIEERVKPIVWKPYAHRSTLVLVRSFMSFQILFGVQFSSFSTKCKLKR